MSIVIRLSIAAALAFSIAACATTPPPPEAQFAPPGKRQLDAKTQLEIGRRY